MAGRGTMFQRIGKIRHRQHSGAGTAVKAAIRQKVLDAIGAERAVVFDAFAGEGTMYRAVWHQARHCVGCDLEFYPADRRLAYVADNRRVLRALDLARFNVFDCDAWGDPWEQVLIVAERRKLAAGEKIGLVFTDGQALKIQYQHRPSRALQQLAAAERPIPGMHREMELVLNRALQQIATLMGGQIIDRWQAGARDRSVMRYGGVVLSDA